MTLLIPRFKTNQAKLQIIYPTLAICVAYMKICMVHLNNYIYFRQWTYNT